jgi:S-DNA-T family DNA segregation ATPase FtsK/SpoIIIE
MARKKSDKTAAQQAAEPGRFKLLMKSETTHFAIGFSATIFAVYLALAFSSYFFTGAADQSVLENHDPGELLQTGVDIKNFAGVRGAQLAEFFINKCFGLAAFFVPLYLLLQGLSLMRAYKLYMWKWFLSCSVLLIWCSIALAFVGGKFFEESFFYLGGLHGRNVCEWLMSQVGALGLTLILLVTAILFSIFVSRQTIQLIRKMLHPEIHLPKSKRAEKADVTATDGETTEGIRTAVEPVYTNPEPAVVDFEIDRPAAETPQETEEETPFPFGSERDDEVPPFMQEDAETTGQDDFHDDFRVTGSDGSEGTAFEVTVPETPLADLKPETPLAPVAEKKEEPIFTVEEELNPEDAAYEGPALQPYNPRLDLENYRFPTLDLLDDVNDDGPNIDMEEQNANKDRIIKVLRSFGIEISSIKASVGPTITLYEITPAEGVRIAKIRNLEDDIALSLAALGIRIIAPIPGKGTIGIEVPNANPRIVSMRSILTSKKFQETTMELPLALGKTITNEVFMVDLAKAPHMLVAGATGQGKSVGLNAIVTSLLYKKHPAELKFVIVDPKKVEFSVYAPIERHFLAKLPDSEDAIITDVTKVVQTLNSLCVEMDTRYDLLRQAGCRNIKEYNAKFIARKLNPEKGHHFMPYIVIIIDEFGDLIMTAGKEVELPICRIAQLARAVGIHAIIATQRPTTNIITGTIKANFPARVAFKVAAMMDSRTILDRSGAQQLVGKGDMLYLQGNDPVRVQCAFVDTPEVEKIAAYISQQQGYPSAFELPEYVGDDADSGSVADVDLNRLDPMFEDAARLIVIHQQGSTSLIQRKFSIGYNRAGRIMDQLEKAGIVGPTQGSKPRDVLCVDETDLQMRLDAIKG